MAPDLRALAIEAPQPVVGAYDGESVTVAGGRTIVRIVSSEFAQRALELVDNYGTREEDLGCTEGLLDRAGEVLLGPYMRDIGHATTVFLMCPFGANKGMFHVWDRYWNLRGVEHEAECRLYVCAGVLLPNLFTQLHTCHGREGCALVGTVGWRAVIAEKEASERRAKVREVLRRAARRDMFVMRAKAIVWRPGGRLAERQ
jgi:hypothetical protein